MKSNRQTFSPPQWDAPTPRVRELLRQGAEIALSAPQEMLDEIDQASMAADVMRFVIDDPVLLAASRRATRACLIHWAAANLEKPGAPVAPYISADMKTNVRELVRRGATDLIFNSTRASQNAAWQLWMNIAFEQTSDPQELRELLDVSARSINSFIDDTLEQIAAFMRTEREEQTRGTHVDRREWVTRIVEGAAISAKLASQRLGYNLEQKHHAAVVWSEEAETELGALEVAAQALTRGASSQQTLTVIANAGTLWVWTTGDHPLDLHPMRLAIKGLPSVRMAIGSADHGVEGFRRAHLDALTAQRVLSRLHANARVVHFDMVRLVSLMAHDAEASLQFVTHTLGELATAPLPLRRALLTFLSTGCNATEASELLHTHRNTLLRRLARAQELLPRPLEHNRVHVAAALEALSWTAEDPLTPERK
ncbi:MAG: PucR family transcriptional regulator [Burkholderiales bacterium]|nr:PucR family transcriptional regulator [Burkholderiales bacterium]